MKTILKLILCSIITLGVTHAYALKEAKPMAIDKRLGVLVYNPYDVHKFTGYYGYQSSIIFAEDEVIETMSMGDSIPWQMVPNGNRLFLKPIEQDATTNLTLITNKHTYYFELHAEEANSINQQGLMFAVKFLYPDEYDAGATSTISSSAGIAVPDLSDKSLYNFEYSISGPNAFAPTKIFDNGRFTYFEFAEKAVELPGIFYVTNSGNEGLVNYRMVGNYVVVESVRERFSLRQGREVVCVYNETLIAQRKEDSSMAKK